MAVVEIRCPRCGSPSSLKDEKTHEYYCDHCGTAFRFVDTTKREVIRDIRRHNCPTCGRPVKADEGYVCTECGKEDLCENCIDEVAHKIVCKECIKKEGSNCRICGNFAPYTCAVCGDKTCRECGHLFDIDGEFGGWGNFSLYCPTCRENVCCTCYVVKSGFFSGSDYYCKKCGSRLKKQPPFHPIPKF